MKLALALATLLLVAACGSDGDTVATDPSGPDSPTSSATAPAAPGTVFSGLVTVMDTGTPEVCFGPVAESYPPQCSGPELVGWDWADHQQMFERQGQVRWGQFALTGTWDGERFTAASAVPAALYDPMPVPSLAVPRPAVEHTQDELEQIAEEVRQLPGAQGSGEVHGDNVIANVVYDDGSLQQWCDQHYGQDTVYLVSSLTDEG
ncbi:hypothetical protein ABLE68_03285 [Nocardioides sp. CN2-186]|uniref:hypothetical protein n=1 Tax=Nocardioides tweenelious TaxID=3156607 RepID=UPI0032B4324D